MKAFQFLYRMYNRANHVFRLFGYARSGQHAISHWLMQQAPQTSLWINNLQGHGEGVDFQHYWYGNINLEEIHLLGLGFEGDIRKLSYTYSDIPLVLVVRDILNQTASIHRHKDLQVTDKYFSYWKRNALQALGEIDLLNSPCITVKYNNWCVSEDYRIEIFEKFARHIGLKSSYQSELHKNVLDIGGGSSFDGIKYTQDATAMETLNRFKDPQVKEALKQIPQELLDLNARLFPDMGT